MRAFDEINHTTIVATPPLSHVETARRAIRSIQRRMDNPALADDVRAAARLELRHWRGILMRGERSETP